MSTEENRSLWEQFDSDAEPWRRGRLVLVLIALLHLLLQALVFAWGVMIDDTEGLVIFSTLAVLFWLQFYLIWIGVHWIRWLAGAWAGLSGFAYVIWGLRDGNLFQIAFGCVSLFVGAYLGLSPAVYFFAKHQQERRNWLLSLAIAAVFVLLFITLGLGSLGLTGYRARLEAHAREFSDEAFGRIFTDHDTYFYLANLSEEGLAASGGQGPATKFLQTTTLQAGDVHNIKASEVKLHLFYRPPAKFGCTGTAITHGIGTKGEIKLRLDLNRIGDRWKIDAIVWRYRNPNLDY